MAESIDVNLPKAHVAQFPDCCVVCGRDGPDGHVRLFTGSIGWWSWLIAWIGKPFSVQAPACNGCAWKLQGRRVLSLLVTVAIAILVIWLAWPYVEEAVPRGLRKWAMLALGAACLIPQAIFEVYYAHPFDITAFDDSVDYEFTSMSYALEFAELNRDATWVKVDDEPWETLGSTTTRESSRPG